MTVYVDEPIHPYGRMLMCHMASPDIVELFAMATTIGVGHRHYQDPFKHHSSRPHFDIAKGKRALAIKNGAQAIDKFKMVVVSTVALNNIALAREPLWRCLDPLRRLRGHPSYDSIRGWLDEPEQADLKKGCELAETHQCSSV